MSKIAFIILDVQQRNIRIAPPTYLPQLAKTINKARSSGVKIINITVSFRPGHPECHPRNKTFGAAAANNILVAGSEDAAMPAEIANVLSHPYPLSECH
jgi:nicotinamidase-related amidase